MGDWNLMPGPAAVRDSAEATFLWNRAQFHMFDQGQIVSGSARDSGNPIATTILRPGLLLGKKTSDSKLYQYAPTATDGTQNVYGINTIPMKMTDVDGNNKDRLYGVCISGPVKNASLILLDQMARQQMRNRFLFDDDFVSWNYWPWKAVVPQTTSYQILLADNGTLFTNSGAVGAVTFTLPAIVNGYVFGFSVWADQNVTITSTEGTNIIGVNGASYTNVAFTTNANRIGGVAKLYSDPGATKWICEVPNPNAVTFS
jgi:hypothetical protein